jgi:hypothetical protein
MLEYHGWLSIRAAPGATETEESDDRDAREFAPRSVAELEPLRGLHDFRATNGMAFVHVAGFTNHRGPDIVNIFTLYNEIVAHAPGSYGLLHVHDDEDPDGKQEQFRV